MQEIKIGNNEEEQRIDRFLRKYFENATKSFIYKMLRKKRIKLNGNRANPEDLIYQGDSIQMYLADETIAKFRGQEKEIDGSNNLHVIYEDDNIVLINKAKGTLAHSSSSEDAEVNVVDEFVSYLYSKGEYLPSEEKTFTPSICNRLDRNTSGIVIGAKNYNTLKEINSALKSREIERYYKTIVKGKMIEDQSLEGYLVKNEKNNKVSISQESQKDGKEIKTDIRVLKSTKDYSLVEINLITGRTHQIRAHLSSINHEVIGDLKYGNSRVNKYFKDKYNLTGQYLHAYKVIFKGLGNGLEYLNNKQFICDLDSDMGLIERDLFGL